MVNPYKDLGFPTCEDEEETRKLQRRRDRCSVTFS
ncbi:unnamed protein product [Brassica rapa subsp. trilocularis]